jgi:hypothetical protein
MIIVPVTLKQSNDFVRTLHRHNKPVAGQKFSVGLAFKGELIGVAIAGRPVSRFLDNGTNLEITRVCTNGFPNACSMLYAACRKAGGALGYKHIYTYTLIEEGGASLRAAGFRNEGKAGGSSTKWHNREGRTVDPVGNDLVGGKRRWVWP